MKNKNKHCVMHKRFSSVCSLCLTANSGTDKLEEIWSAPEWNPKR